MDLSEPSNSQPVPKRKGKMAKHRDAEKFRMSKNKVFDSALVSKHLELRTLPSAVSTMFSDLSYAPTIRPTACTTIYITVLPRLILLICGYLRDSCKVAISNDELIALAHVTMLQIEARVFRARIGTSFPPDQDKESLVFRTSKIFRENLFPLTHYIQCFGRVKHENQVHIPILGFQESDFVSCFTELGFPIATAPQKVIQLGEGNPLYGSPIWVEFVSDAAILMATQRGVLIEGSLQFSPRYLNNPAGFDLSGLVKIGPPRSILPSVELTVTRYHSLISKVSRRVPQCLETIDFDSEGHLSILTRCKNVELGLSEVWSDRFIPDDALVLGAVLKFGVEPDGPDDRICVLANVETTGTLERYARLAQERAQAQ